MFRFYIISLATIVIDQLSKIYVVHLLNLKERQSIEVLGSFINFKMAWNTGINFGLFASSAQTSRIILIVISLVIITGLFWWLRFNKEKHIQCFVALIVGGALGNLIDRIVFGAVADFLNVSCCGISNPFSFNFADIAIFLGAMGLIVYNKSEAK